MKDIQPQDRLVANVRHDAFAPWINADGSDSGTAVLQLGDRAEMALVFHLYRRAP